MRLEEIMNLEVPLIRDEFLSRQYGAKVSYLDGSVFQTRTVKDLRNAHRIIKDRKSGLDYIVYYDITYGNSGLSLAFCVTDEMECDEDHLSRLQISHRHVLSLVVIPTGYQDLMADMGVLNGIVCERDFSEPISEADIRKTAFKWLTREKWEPEKWIVLPIVDPDQSGSGYHRLGEEILRQTNDTDKIFVPYGSGETGLGIYRFFAERFYDRKIKKMPRVVFVQSEGRREIKNKSLTEDKTRTAHIAFEHIVEPLHAQGKIDVIDVSEEERDHEYTLLRDRINLEKTSALAFAGARKYTLNQDDSVVIVNTGRSLMYEKRFFR